MKVTDKAIKGSRSQDGQNPPGNASCIPKLKHYTLHRWKVKEGLKFDNQHKHPGRQTEAIIHDHVIK